MDEATIALTATTLGVLIVFIVVFIWCLKSGQFHDVEGPKYRILDDENNDDGAGGG